jgi:hypothetical protein
VRAVGLMEGEKGKKGRGLFPGSVIWRRFLDGLRRLGKVQRVDMVRVWSSST